MVTQDEGNVQPRSHGFSRPWDSLQVISWGLIGLFLSLFFTFNGLFLRPPLGYALCIVYGALATMTLILNSLTTRSNAADPMISNKLSEHDMYCQAIPTNLTLCQLCHAYVNKSSKHCGRCNKCVIGFDHHCKWLNNCIGKSNYRLFFSFVTVTLSTLAFHFGLGLYQFIDSFLDPDFYDVRIKSVYGSPFGSIFQAFDGVITALAFVAMALLAHLFGFHVMLIAKGQTTYEWIMARRNRNAMVRSPHGTEQEYDKPFDVTRPRPFAYQGNQDFPGRSSNYATQPQPDQEANTAMPPESPQSPSESGRSTSSQSGRSSIAPRKNSSSMRSNRTPKSGTVNEYTFHSMASKAGAGQAEAPKADSLNIDMSLPILPPLPAHLRTFHTPRRHPPTASEDPLERSSSAAGTALDGHGGGKMACCADVTELLLGQEPMVDFSQPSAPAFPELNAPQP